VGDAQEAPHPPRSPPRSSSRPPAPGARATAYFSSTSPWATSPSWSSPLHPHHEPPVSFCLNVAAEPGPFILHHVNDIEISHPELYNDGRFMVHELAGDGRGRRRRHEHFLGDGAGVRRGIRGGMKDEGVDRRAGVAPPPAHGHHNTFLEMEPEYVVGYAEAQKMKVWTVGPVSLHHRRDSSSSLHAIVAREAARLGRPRPRPSRRRRQAGGGEEGPNLGPTGLDLGSGVFFF
jgi:hypothetical protein